MANPTLDHINILLLEGQNAIERFGPPLDGKQDQSPYLSRMPAHEDVRRRMIEAALAFSAGNPADTIREMLMVIFGRAMWAKYHYPIFRLTEDLTGALFLTDTKDITLTDLQFPFPSFVLQIPGGFIPYREDGYSGWIKLIWVCRYVAEGKECLFVQAFCTEMQRVVWSRWPIEHFLDPAIFELSEEKLVSIFRNDTAYTHNDAETLTATFRLLMSAVLWINAKNALNSVEAESPKPKHAPPGTPSPTLWNIGRTVKLSHALKQAARDSVTGTKAEWSLKYQSVTRGHHQRYHVGQGRKETIWKWKEPYIRAAENETAEVRVYDAG